jgi:hypothetical protein
MNRTRASLLAAAAAAATAAPAGAQATALNDDFDCYQPGDAISAQASWGLWPGGEEAYVSDERAFSGGNSLHLDQPGVDIAHQFSGFHLKRITYRMMTYVPSDSVGLEAYIVALNMYDGAGYGAVWSTQVKVDAPADVLEAQFRGDTTPLIVDRWVEWRAEIDTSANEYDLYYDGALWAPGLPWVAGIGGPGIPDLQAIDLYVHALDSGPGMYVDDVLVTEAGLATPPTCGIMCYADCDGSSAVDFFDFLCFQNQFGAGDARADCDQDGDLTFFDFLCFQDEFAAGCR